MKQDLVFKNLIGGQWRDSRTGSRFADENPTERGSSLAVFPSSSREDVVQALDAAQAAFTKWSRTPVSERQAFGAHFLGLVAQNRSELARIISLENGKTLREAGVEIDSALKEGSHHVEQMSVFAGHTIPDRAGAYMGWMQYHALGVVAVISPWNFPANVLCRKALPALLTGNTVVFKPATYTPWTGVFLAQLFEKAGAPAGVFNCVTGLGSSIGNVLIDDPRVRAISFTGSTSVGKKILERAARNLSRTQLELGGKNPLVVFDDAELDDAVEAAMTAGFACAGQWCTSTSRILLQEGIHDRFLERLLKRCEAMTVGDPLQDETDMGPVAGEEQFRSISHAIELAKTENAELLTGGVATKDELKKGYFIRPTVFSKVTPKHTLFREEVFGPVLAVTRFGTIDEAIALANDSAYALSSSVYSSDIAKAMRCVREIDAGMVHINLHTGLKDPGLPFGGWKESGFGPPENSRSGLEFFVEMKAVYLKSKA